ncbi:hypothetical protein SCHPADRAFT_586111 [Schizopora paradoxa]|uniref:Uncharacterized protein n=1 Tax=Schizopora paradoxa TaxID=27342 RepID=A0A0H2RW23_9AGAM|nr:hypothetical protein SCHPADRAFT_586111 [Schizopora paradoxa]
METGVDGMRGARWTAFRFHPGRLYPIHLATIISPSSFLLDSQSNSQLQAFRHLCHHMSTVGRFVSFCVAAQRSRVSTCGLFFSSMFCETSSWFKLFVVAGKNFKEKPRGMQRLEDFVSKRRSITTATFTPSQCIPLCLNTSNAFLTDLLSETARKSIKNMCRQE